MTLSRRAALFGVASTLSCSVWSAPPGSSFPSKSVRLVVPFPPGGSNDVLARVLGEALGRGWGIPVIVDNHSGAAGNIGADLVAKSPPDGYTLLISPNNILTMNPALFAKLPFDPVGDLTSITLLGTVPVALAVSPNLGVRTVSELIVSARRAKVPFTYGSGGIGSPQHLSAEMFRSLAKIELVHVPYKGAAPAITDLLAGQIQMFFGAVNSLLPHFNSGKLLALGVGGSARIAALPQVPTISEAGVEGYNSDIWVGLSAPRRTPKNIIEIVSRSIGAALAGAENQAKLRAQGIEPASSTPEAMDALVKSDLRRWTRIIKDAGVHAD